MEGLLLDDYPGDERFEDLLEACASYAPGMGSPYVGAADMRAVIEQAVRVLKPID